MSLISKNPGEQQKPLILSSQRIPEVLLRTSIFVIQKMGVKLKTSSTSLGCLSYQAPMNFGPGAIESKGGGSFGSAPIMHLAVPSSNVELR